MPVSVKVGGAWKTATAVYNKVGGVWKTASDMPVKIAGAWKTGILSAPNFFATLDGTGNDSAKGIKVGASGSIYIGSSLSGSGSGDIGVAKYNSSGVIQWQRRLASAGYDIGNGIGLDSSENVYVCGMSNSSDIFLAKYNSSGTIQWQRRLGASSGQGRGIAVDSSGNSHIVGYSYFAPIDATRLVVTKYNTSGTIQWQRRLGSAFSVGEAIAVDSSGNVFVTGEGNNGKIIIAKYDSSGTIQWQISSSSSGTGEGLTTDSSGNIYVLGKQTSPVGIGFVIKMNTSGSILWQRSVTAPQNNAVLNGIAVDNSSNVYVSGEADFATGTARDILLAKFDSSGTIQWQRRISGADSDYSWDIAVDSSGSVIFSADTWLGSYGMFIGVIPTDGSKTGSYTVGSQTFTYASGSTTIATSSLSFSTSSLTADTPTLTSSDPALTESASTLTSNVRLL